MLKVEKDILRKMYLEDMLNAREIGERLGASTRTIQYHLKKHDIKSRSKREARKLARIDYSFVGKGEKHISWKGGRRKRANGYIEVYSPDHPRANGLYVLEHILVAEKMIGRPLAEDEQVHHINGNKEDNSPYNLYLCRDAQEHKDIEYRANHCIGETVWSNLL